MHGRFEGREDFRKGTNLRQDIGLGFLVLPVVIAIALLALLVIQPAGSNWIAEAVQAEFVGDTIPLSPTQLAQEPHSATAEWMTAYRGQR
jgi:hypothetical protein